jgi:HEAT repeat protein
VHQSPSNHGQILFEIYESSSDVNVKRAALNALSASGDTDRFLQIAKTEKDAELRRDAVRRLTSLKNPAATDALVAMYGSEQDKEVKRAIVNSLASQNDVKQLVAVARTEKDPEMRYIVSRLAGMKSPEASDYLMEILKK